MSFLYNVLKSESQSHLSNTIPSSNSQHQARNSGTIPSFFVKHDCFKVGIGLTEFTEPSDLLNFKPFYKNSI